MAKTKWGWDYEMTEEELEAWRDEILNSPKTPKSKWRLEKIEDQLKRMREAKKGE
jgi:hypothetical protein